MRAFSSPQLRVVDRDDADDLVCPPTRSSYVSSWLTFLRTHELVGETRLKFAAQLSEMSDELTALGKEVDKNRKSAKELASKLEKGLQEQEALVDRVRCRSDHTKKPDPFLALC